MIDNLTLHADYLSSTNGTTSTADGLQSLYTNANNSVAVSRLLPDADVPPVIQPDHGLIEQVTVYEDGADDTLNTAIAAG